MKLVFGRVKVICQIFYGQNVSPIIYYLDLKMIICTKLIHLRLILNFTKSNKKIYLNIIIIYRKKFFKKSTLKRIKNSSYCIEKQNDSSENDDEDHKDSIKTKVIIYT